MTTDYNVEARADAYRERLLDRHLASERSDAEEDACYEAWLDDLADYCGKCDWQGDDGNPRPASGMQPCESCMENLPGTHEEWCQHWHDDMERERAEAIGEARAEAILDGWDY